MLLQMLRDATLYPALLRIDQELAAEHQAKRCLQCKGPLHVANYSRKPRGVIDLPADNHFRLSFCCAREGCRQRMTPPSVRYLNHKVYLGVVVTLLTALTQGVAQHQVRVLRSSLGLDRRTLSRWQRWWREVVPSTQFWRWWRTQFITPIDENTIPQELVQRFRAHSVEGLLRLLIFLSPLSVKQTS